MQTFILNCMYACVRFVCERVCILFSLHFRFLTFADRVPCIRNWERERENKKKFHPYTFFDSIENARMRVCQKLFFATSSIRSQSVCQHTPAIRNVVYGIWSNEVFSRISFLQYGNQINCTLAYIHMINFDCTI